MMYSMMYVTIISATAQIGVAISQLQVGLDKNYGREKNGNTNHESENFDHKFNRLGFPWISK